MQSAPGPGQQSDLGLAPDLALVALDEAWDCLAFVCPTTQYADARAAAVDGVSLARSDEFGLPGQRGTGIRGDDHSRAP